jgi:putative nucleotidyltransferase with HDIG domain
VNRILFVDDEPNVLAGLKRMLYSLRNEWDMKFVTSGAEALQCLSESPFEVLVTDVRMPGMSGVELLEQVVKLHPEVIRMVLSGTADVEITLQCVSLSHQYLLKPCDAQTLRATVQRAFCLRVLLYNPALRGLISQIQSLPSIPAVYGELTTVLRSSDASPQAVGRIMARDMGMTAKVLQLVNSAFFGIRREIANPVDAVVYLGMETVRALVFTASAFSRFQLSSRCHFSIDELQQHSLAVGTLARQIARSMGLIPAVVDHAFVGGLLHDIGKLVLASNYPEQYHEILQRVGEGSVRISDAECDTFGTSHAEIGAYLLWLWGLPDPVAEILALHHHPSSDAEVPPAVVAVHFANALVNEESERDMDLACLQTVRQEDPLPCWRQIYEDMSQKFGRRTVSVNHRGARPPGANPLRQHRSLE